MFKRISVFLASLAILAQAAYAQTRFAIQDPEGSRTVVFTDGTDTLRTPQEGLWSIATGWEDDWMTGWVHVRPSSVETSGGWTILKGKASFPKGDLLLTDSYSLTREGLVHCVRRFEWNGSETLPKVTLSVRLQKEGTGLQLMAPGIIYYGNKNGSAVNPELVAVWNGQPGEFAIFEDHRYPMPFVMLEDPSRLEAVAVHTVPSPVRGAVLQDQWWSLGAEARDGLTEIVLYSGPIGYNGTHSVAKALQRKPMRYSDTWIDMEPGRVVEKEYYIDVYGISRKGTGFQRPVYTALDLYKPYDADRFAPFGEIIEAKYRFALSRWFEGESFAGFDMYDPRSGRKRIVMGWCGQVASRGYALHT